MLYDATARDLLGYLLRRAPTPEDASDYLAETFLIAWDKRDAIPPDLADARPWLFGVARNVLSRGHERTRRTSQATAELAGAVRSTREHRDADQPITRALQLLSPIDREIITMLAWDQLPPRDIAAILGLSPNVVRVRAHRARIKLRQHLAAADPTSLARVTTTHQHQQRT